MTTLAPLRSTLAHPHHATAAAKTMFTATTGRRFLSLSSTPSVLFARPCSIIAPATTIRYQQQLDPSSRTDKQQARAFSLFGSPKANPNLVPKAVQNEIPEALMHHSHPMPMREEFMGKKRLSTKDLEAIPVELGYHREPAGMSDWIAYQVVKSMRIPVDLFFRTKYIHRVVALETVAAVVSLSLFLSLSLSLR